LAQLVRSFARPEREVPFEVTVISAKPPRVVFIILAHNDWPDTDACLKSVREVAYSNYGVLLIDNGSEDQTFENTRAAYPGIEVIRSRTNLGFAAGANLALRHVLGSGEAPYVFLLNNDALVPTDLLAELVPILHSEPQIALVTGPIAFANRPGTLWSIGSRMDRTLSPVDFSPGRIDHKLASQPRDVDFILGTAALARVSALERVDLFDEGFFFYYEDLDLCLRLKHAGFRLRYVPHPTVLHRVEATSTKPSVFGQYHLARSSVRYYRKHGRGRFWYLVPLRLGSGVKRISGLMFRGDILAAAAYLRGIRDGLREARPSANGR
jgi:GT2 family glycosyltransferase